VDVAAAPSEAATIINGIPIVIEELDKSD